MPAAVHWRLDTAFHRRPLRLAALAAAALPLSAAPAHAADWADYGGDPQHTSLSTYASASLETLKWSTPVDLAPQFSHGDLLAHYGSPLITAANTVLVPVKTGASGGFEVDARAGADGSLIWSLSTDYVLPPHSWVPPFSPAIATGRLYMPAIGGGVIFRDSIDSATGATGRVNIFPDYATNSSAYNGSVFINTPITADSSGDIYFGYQSTNGAVAASGIARITPAGVVTTQSISTLVPDLGGSAKLAGNAAPALSPDGATLFIAVNASSFSTGKLLALSSSSLSLQAGVGLPDNKGGLAPLFDISSASPMVGPDGDVYFGVLDNQNTSRGWMDHFSYDATTQTFTQKPTGGFGWDDTASVIPASMVPSYHGSSTYLILTKYNNYFQTGGQGDNRLAILDPNDTQLDTRNNSSGTMIMKEVLTIRGVTPDDEAGPSFPNAVREWCINAAVADPATDSVLANSEDGKTYRWDLTTNTFTQVFTMNAGVGEAYTSTLVGPDGTIYAINGGLLHAIGTPAGGPTPTPRFYVGPAIGTWNTFFNWSTSADGAVGPSVPLDGDSVTIHPSVTTSITYDGHVKGTGLTTLALDADAGATATLTQLAGTLVVGSVSIGPNGVLHADGGNFVVGAITSAGVYTQNGVSTHSGDFTITAGTATLGGLQSWASTSHLVAQGGSLTLASDPGAATAYNLAIAVTPSAGAATMHIASHTGDAVHLRDLRVNDAGSGGDGLLVIDAALDGSSPNPATGFGAQGGSVAVYIGNGEAPGGAGLPARATIENLWRAAALEGYWAVVNQKVSVATRGLTLADNVVTDPARNGLVVVPSVDELNQPALYVGEDIQGDTNGDGKVDVNDVGVVLEHLNTTPGSIAAETGYTIYTPGEGDVNGDLVVDVNDLGAVLANLNQTYSPAASAASSIPEPATASLLLLAAAPLVRRRRTV